MKTSLIQALELIFSGNVELLNILEVTAKMSLRSSVIALLIGLPIGSSFTNSCTRAISIASITSWLRKWALTS